MTPSPECELEQPWSELCHRNALFIVHLDRFIFSLFQSEPLSISYLDDLSISSVALCTSNCNKWHCPWIVGV